MAQFTKKHGFGPNKVMLLTSYLAAWGSLGNRRSRTTGRLKGTEQKCRLISELQGFLELRKRACPFPQNLGLPPPFQAVGQHQWYHFGPIGMFTGTGVFDPWPYIYIYTHVKQEPFSSLGSLLPDRTEGPGPQGAMIRFGPNSISSPEASAPTGFPRVFSCNQTPKTGALKKEPKQPFFRGSPVLECGASHLGHSARHAW